MIYSFRPACFKTLLYVPGASSFSVAEGQVRRAREVCRTGTQARSRPIRPRDCAKVWRNGEAAEVRWIAERLEYWTLKVCRKINLARFAVLESEPDRVIKDVPSFHYINHRPTPTARLPWVGASPAPTANSAAPDERKAFWVLNGFDGQIYI